MSFCLRVGAHLGEEEVKVFGVVRRETFSMALFSKCLGFPYSSAGLPYSSMFVPLLMRFHNML